MHYIEEIFAKGAKEFDPGKDISSKKVFGDLKTKVKLSQLACASLFAMSRFNKFFQPLDTAAPIGIIFDCGINEKAMDMWDWARELGVEVLTKLIAKPEKRIGYHPFKHNEYTFKIYIEVKFVLDKEKMGDNFDSLSTIPDSRGLVKRYYMALHGHDQGRLRGLLRLQPQAPRQTQGRKGSQNARGGC